ncbi:MAG TPA: ATP-dependent DNA ligase [Bryobacteraceae bacterium]|jgi:DNA ligase-1
MPLSDLVETSQRVAATSKRNEKIELVSNLLKRTAPDEIDIAAAYLSGATRQGRIGIGYASLRDAGAPPAESATLQIVDVDRALDAIADVRGRGSEQRKTELLHSLFARATGPEQEFLVRLLAGELRQGALEGVMLEAIAKASGIALERIRRAVMMAGDAAEVAKAALASGANFDQYDIRLFRPVKPMLAQTSEDAAAALTEFGEAALEYKFDGARVQVHRSGDDVRVFSRALNDVTAAAPEIVEAARQLPARDLILDGEVLSFTPEGAPQPFQVTMRRFGRKLDLERMRAELPLTPVWFDLLYLAGTPLVDEPQSLRFAALAELSPPQHLIPNIVTADPEKAEEFLRQSLDRGHEGVMAKAREALYAAGARGQGWRKIKKVHTLDLAILAAEWGHGRRHGRLSNLHLGARDPAAGGFAMLGKTFKGMTDEMLAWQTAELLKIEVARDAYTVYVEPKFVAEIAFGDIQVSPRYPRGMALRFARVKRYRLDKSAAEADTVETVRKLAGLT